MNKIILGVIVLVMTAIPQQAMAEMVGALMPNSKIPHFMTMHKSMVKELENLGIDAEVVLQKPAPSEMAWKNATRHVNNAGKSRLPKEKHKPGTRYIKVAPEGATFSVS